MRRRRFLFAGVSGLLAGCSANVRTLTRASTSTPPETVSECRDPPTVPSNPAREGAREFVAAHERTRVSNYLIAQDGGPEECRPGGPGVVAESEGTNGAIDVTIETLQTAVTATVEGGYYVVSTCEGSAEYWCPESARVCSHSTRNAAFVTHFVGDGRHVRIPHNWTACHYEADPFTGPDAASTITVPEGESGLRLRVYDFSEAETEISLELLHEGTGVTVFERPSQPPHGPSVHANVAVRTGTYRLVAATDRDSETATFTLSSFEDPSRDGICVYHGPDGTLTIVEVGTTGELAPPVGVCTERRIDQDTREESA